MTATWKWAAGAFAVPAAAGLIAWGALTTRVGKAEETHAATVAEVADVGKRTSVLEAEQARAQAERRELHRDVEVGFGWLSDRLDRLEAKIDALLEQRRRR